MHRYIIHVYDLEDLEQLQEVVKKFKGIIISEEPVDWRVAIDFPEWVSMRDITANKWDYKPDIEDQG